MSYQEKNVIVSLLTTLIVFSYYLFNIVALYRDGTPAPVAVFTLWAMVIVLSIAVNIIATIVTQVVTSVVHGVRTGEDETDFITDERDTFIDLRGTRNAYVVAGVGVFIAMVTFVVGMSPLVMFNLLLFALIAAEIVGDLSRLVMYRRGV